MRKIISKEELLKALQNANPGITINNCVIDSDCVVINYNKEPHFKVTDQLLVRALTNNCFYLPDSNRVESLVREIVSNLSKEDATIIRVICGIDNKLPKNLKESTKILRTKGIRFLSINAFTEKSLRKRVRGIGVVLRKELSKRYTPSCLVMTTAEIEKLQISDFVNVYHLYTKFTKLTNHVKRCFEDNKENFIFCFIK